MGPRKSVRHRFRSRTHVAERDNAVGALSGGHAGTAPCTTPEAQQRALISPGARVRLFYGPWAHLVPWRGLARSAHSREPVWGIPQRMPTRERAPPACVFQQHAPVYSCSTLTRMLMRRGDASISRAAARNGLAPRRGTQIKIKHYTCSLRATREQARRALCMLSMQNGPRSEAAPVQALAHGERAAPACAAAKAAQNQERRGPHPARAHAQRAAASNTALQHCLRPGGLTKANASTWTRPQAVRMPTRRAAARRLNSATDHREPQPLQGPSAG